MPSLSDTDRAVLSSIAHHAGEDRDHRDGWCRWSVDGHPWDVYRPLVAAGLLERRETWKDVLLRLTRAGWAVLFAAPATELPDMRSNVKGDILP
jgi:hypothetical protein